MIYILVLKDLYPIEPIIRRYNALDIEALHVKFLDKHSSVSRKMGQVVSLVSLRYFAPLLLIGQLALALYGCCLAPVRLDERQYLRSSIVPDDTLASYTKTRDECFSSQSRYVQLTFPEPLDYYNSKLVDPWLFKKFFHVYIIDKVVKHYFYGL